MSNVAQIIERLRDLARSAEQIDMQLDKQYGIDRTLGVEISDLKARERRYATNTAADQMEEYLDGFDIEILRRVQAVMYSGRQGADAAVDERDTLRTTCSTKEEVVRTIIEKRASFDPYFDRGLNRAKKDGIDLDTF